MSPTGSTFRVGLGPFPGAAPTTGHPYPPVKQVPDVALKRATQPVEDLQFGVLRAAFQPSKRGLADAKPSSELPLAEPRRLPKVPHRIRKLLRKVHEEARLRSL